MLRMLREIIQEILEKNGIPKEKRKKDMTVITHIYTCKCIAYMYACIKSKNIRIKRGQTIIVVFLHTHNVGPHCDTPKDKRSENHDGKNKPGEAKGITVVWKEGGRPA